MDFPTSFSTLVTCIESFMPLAQDAVDVAETVGKDLSAHKDAMQVLQDAFAAFKADLAATK